MTQEHIEAPRKAGFLPWLIWTLSALFVVFNYVQQIVPNVILPELAQAFHAGLGALGIVAATYFYAYACMQIPVGLIADRFGARVPLVIAIAVAALGTLGFAMAQGTTEAQIARLVMGLSFSFSFIGCLKLVQEWFPSSQFSTLAGMTNTAGMIGAATSAPVAMLVRSLSWRGAIASMGVTLLLLAVLVLLIVRDRHAVEPIQQKGTGGLRIVLANPQVWLNAIYATSISLVFVGFGGLWGASYIEKVYHVGNIEADGATSLLFFGGIAGSLFLGWVSDFLHRRKLPMVLSGIAALAAMVAMLYLPLPLAAFKAGLFAVGFFSSANIISYAAARDLHPDLAGFSIGFLSTCFYAGSATSQPVIGMILQHFSPAGLEAVTAGEFRVALSPLVILMGVGVVASGAMRETSREVRASKMR